MRHGYEDLCNEVLPETLDKSPNDVSNSLGPFQFADWVSSAVCMPIMIIPTPPTRTQKLYRDAWTSALLNARKPPPPGGILHKGGALECDFWNNFILATIDDIGVSLNVLPQIPAIIQKNCGELRGCGVCKLRALSWQRQVQQHINAIPRFRV